MKISDITAEISTKYHILATTEAKSVMEIRLREKSLKNKKFSDILPIYRYRTEISAKFRRVKHTRVWVIFCFKISKIYRKYR